MKSIRIAAAQTLEYREDVEVAVDHLVEVARKAEALGVQLLCFPECFLQGYLTDEPSAGRAAIQLDSPRFAELVGRLSEIRAMVVFGLIERDGNRLFNTAVVVRAGEYVGRYRKAHLLEGERLFTPGAETPIFGIDGLRFGINICNDTNSPRAAHILAEAGASLIVCPANNMMGQERAEFYRDLHNAARTRRCREAGLWLISADVTGRHGGRAGLGPTAVLAPDGRVAVQLPLDEPGLLVFDRPYPPASSLPRNDSSVSLPP